MLRRLHSLHLTAHSSSSLGPGTSSAAEGSGGLSVASMGSAVSLGKSFPKTTELQNHPIGDELKPASLKSIKPSIERSSDQRVLLKFGNFCLVLPRGKIMFLGSLMLFTLYILRKRYAILKW